MTETVFVTGASGFIAQHIIVKLIEKGYNVVGTVRSTEKGELLRSQLNTPKFSYELVHDIQHATAIGKALSKHPEATIFLHTASPFHFSTENVETDLLNPAVEGTKNALLAVKKYGPQVKKVVVTSSYAAIAPAETEGVPEFVVTELTWNNISWEDAKKDAFSGYRGSKAFAEKACWEFIKENNTSFTLATVNPGLVFGPQAFITGVKETLNTSSEVLNGIIKLQPGDPLPPYKGTFVDVRDVALAHLVAFEKEEAQGKRLLLCNGRGCAQSVLDVLHENFPELAHLPKGEVGTGPDILKKMSTIDNQATRKLLGFPLISLKDSVVDSVRQILDCKK